MGNGRKKTPDVPKARPWAASFVQTAAISAEAPDENGVGATTGTGVLGRRAQPGAPIDYCEREHALRFEVLNQASPRLGQTVRLLLASPPLVADADGQPVGVLTDEQESAILQCLVDAFAITGRVTVLDPDGRAGEICVAGRREVG